MARFVTGDVVVMPFPFSDLSDAKRRPAVVVAVTPDQRLICCAITSKLHSDACSLPLIAGDFTQGHLEKASCVRAAYVFTATQELVSYSVGQLSTAKVNEIRSCLISLLAPAHAR